MHKKKQIQIRKLNNLNKKTKNNILNLMITLLHNFHKGISSNKLQITMMNQSIVKQVKTQLSQKTIALSLAVNLTTS